MLKPDLININEFSYELPDDRIAKYPLAKRDGSKLLFFNEDKILHKTFTDLPELLPSGTRLVFNDTKVIQARLLFTKETGAAIEIFLLEPRFPSDYSLSFQSTFTTSWKCLIGNLKRWKSGKLEKKIDTQKGHVLMLAELIDEVDESKIVRFTWDNPELCFSDLILNAGLTPLPPYLNREAEHPDRLRYQTVYSNYEGSVAAPTAGLHFTESILKKLDKKGILSSKLTLHVGAGTFIPVKGLNAIQHNMHTEHFHVSVKSLQELVDGNNKMVPVGTTSLRTLESLYWLGVRLHQKKSGYDIPCLDQWEAYSLRSDLTRTQALGCIIQHLQENRLECLKAATRLMIVPGYGFKMTDGLLTNFHQPKSTLLLLVAALIGEKWKEVYGQALQNDYRFLSYGDSSLLLRES